MLRHVYGYSDEYSELFQRNFSFYQIIGCRHQPACLTPSANKNEEVPYYRPYSEPRQTRLYFKGFSLQFLRKYAASFTSQSDCDICQHSSIRRIAPCSKF